MISAMTFEDLVGIFDRHVNSESEDAIDARDRLAAWLEDVGGEEAVIRRDVRIILASADFGKEIMTTALWLNDVFSTDISCVRMTPYRVQDRLLLNIEQVIPLPEAEEITVQLRRREVASRVVTGSSRDLTQYTIATPSGVTEPLRKRHAVLEMAHTVHGAGVPGETMVDVLGRQLRSVDGTLEDDELRDAFLIAYPKADLRRWFFARPFYESGLTWVVSNQWGRNTESALAGLADLVPDGGISYASS
jgi:hypothetical protein